MAEVVGTISAVLGIAHLSAKLLGAGYTFLSGMKHAPTEIQAVLTEVAGLNCVIGRLQNLAESEADSENGVSKTLALVADVGVLGQCEELLVEIEGTMRNYERLHLQHTSGARKPGSSAAIGLGQRLRWPRNEKKTKDTIERLTRLRGIVATALEADSTETLRRIEGAQDKMAQKLDSLHLNVRHRDDTDRVKQVSDWLCPARAVNDMYLHLQTLLALRQPGTGDWLLTSKMFQQWVQHLPPPPIDPCKGRYSFVSRNWKPTLLWITGLPGIGKTVLAATAIHYLQPLRDKSTSPVPSNRGVVFYFFGAQRVTSEDAVKCFLENIAGQFLNLSESCLEIARSKCEGRLQRLSVLEYADLIRDFSGSLDSIPFLIVDGLDEVPTPEREKIASLLKELSHLPHLTGGAHPSFKGVKVLLISRKDPTLEEIFPCPPTPQLQVGDHVEDDLKKYIKAEIIRRIKNKKLRTRDDRMISTIELTLAARAGTFLQAKYQLDNLTAARTDRELRTALEQLPNGLGATYKQILESAVERYPAQVEEIQAVIRWLVAGMRPFTTDELAEIVSVRSGDKFLDFEGILTEPDQVIAPISQLLTVYPAGRCRFVAFSHATVREYITGGQIISGSDSSVAATATGFHTSEVKAHAVLAESCIHYLSLSDFDEERLPERQLMSLEWLRELTRKYAFLEYAALRWSDHLEGSRLSSTDPLKYARDILPKITWFTHPDICPRKYRMCSLLTNDTYVDEDDAYHARKRMTSLGLGGENGLSTQEASLRYAISSEADKLLDTILGSMSPQDVNRHFADGLTPLMLAAEWNNVHAAKRLLQAGAMVDLREPHRRLTPLHVAAEAASAEVLETLLAAGADPHARSRTLTTPFYRAARGGSVEILNRLKELGSDVDAKTWDGWTPLMEAIENRHEDAVNLLLGWGADPTNQGLHGTTPMWLAEPSPSLRATLQRAIRSRGAANDLGLGGDK